MSDISKPGDKIHMTSRNTKKFCSFPQSVICVPYILTINKKHFPSGIYRNISVIEVGAGTAWSVQRFATGWTVWGLNSGAEVIFRTRPDRPWDLPVSYTLGTASLPLG
jgi:hypothetical protein